MFVNLPSGMVFLPDDTPAIASYETKKQLAICQNQMAKAFMFQAALKQVANKALVSKEQLKAVDSKLSKVDKMLRKNQLKGDANAPLLLAQCGFIFFKIVTRLSNENKHSVLKNLPIYLLAEMPVNKPA